MKFADYPFPLLISLHKSGSTWVFSYIHKHYRKRGITMPPNNLYSEFFVDAPYFSQRHLRTYSLNKIKNEFIKRSLEERFALLELLRKFGLELALKAHVPEIIDIWPRFKEFYKDYDILVLKRRHIFSHYLNISIFPLCSTSSWSSFPQRQRRRRLHQYCTIKDTSRSVGRYLKALY